MKLMKKRVIFSIIFCLTLILGFSVFQFAPKNNFSNKLSFSEFENEVISLIKNDDYSAITVNKNISMQSLENIVLNRKNETSNLLSINSNNKLNFEEIKTYLNQYDFTISEENDTYKIRNKYSLNRIIVLGKDFNNYNASKVISGYKNYNILCYNSIEETKYAYNMLKSNPNLTVVLDSVITKADLEISTQSTYNYSNYNTWGAEAMDLGHYNEYYSTKGIKKDIVVAVLDTGINTTHEMFSNRFLKNNGSIVGYAYYNSTSSNSFYSFEDDEGHGTHVAGIVCDLTPSNVKIIPLKVLNRNGTGDVVGIITALEKINEEYSKTYHIACANLSLGGELDDASKVISTINQFDDIFTTLKNKNILSVVAAGNEGEDTSTHVPAACNDSAIVVSSIKQYNGYYTFDNDFSNSNFGTSVDICAAGGKITSAYIGSSTTYAIGSGTSMAAPHVAAAVALLCLDGAYYTNNTPTYNAEDIEKRLYASAVDLGITGKDIYYGYGMVNFLNHLEEIIFTATDCVTTYDGNYHNISVNVENTTDYSIKYGLSPTSYDITDITQNDTFKNFTNGKIPIYFIITKASYSVKGQAYLNIKKANVHFTVGNQSSTYGENINLAQNDYALTSGRIYNGDNLNISLTTSATNKSSVGSYPVRLYYNNSNYNVTYTQGSYSITKRPISIKILQQESIYGNTVNLNHSEYTITSGSIVNNDNLGIVLSTTATSTSNFGNYPITLDSFSNSNYTITSENANLAIKKRNIAISPITQSSEYGEQISLNHSMYTITSGSIVNGDETSMGIILSTNANIMAVGDYNISYLSHSNNNYSITSTNGTYKVTPRNIEITVLNQTSTYGDEISLDSSKYVLTSGSIIKNDNLNILLITNANNHSKIGYYDINLTYNNSNYKITYTKGQLEITPRTISISVGEQTITYGDVVNISNNYSVVNGEVINNDDLDINISTSASSNSSSGIYTINASSSNKNYTIIVTNNMLTVKKRKITLNVIKSSVYGDEINLNNTDYTTIEGSVVNNDNLGLIISTTATNLSKIGKYNINVDLSNANENYDITINTTEYTITPKHISIVLTNQEGVYGNKVLLNHSQYYVNKNDLVGNDVLDVLLSTTANENCKVGKYPISAKISNENYILHSNIANFVINKRPITVKLLNQTMPYSFNYDLDNNAYVVVEGTVINNDDLKLSVYSEDNLFNFAGSQKLSATTNNNNYEITFIDAELIVEFSPTALAIIATPIISIIAITTVVIVVRVKKSKNRIFE